MNLVLLGPRVLVRPEPLPEQGDSTLYLSERQDAAVYGTVVALGNGPAFVRDAVIAAAPDDITPKTLQDLLINLQDEHLVSVGDRVLFSPSAGEWLWFEREEMILLMEDDLLAVVGEGDDVAPDEIETEVRNWDGAYDEVTR